MSRFRMTPPPVRYHVLLYAIAAVMLAIAGCGGDDDDSGRNFKLMIDTAPKAQLRYYNLLAEQHEYYNADPELKARQIKGVGEDSAYGGAGAWWTRGRNQLVVYDHNKILKVRVNVGGWSDAR